MGNPHELLLSALSSHRHAYISGPNFSARSEVLQHITRLPIASAAKGCDSYGNKLPHPDHEHSPRRFAYVGPEIYNSLSGLASTVTSELRLHAFGNHKEAAALAKAAGLEDDLADRSCFELSGGQQAVLATVSAAVLQPRILALDRCLEQVDTSRRERLLQEVARYAAETSIVVAENEPDQLPVLNGSTQIRTDVATAELPAMSPERCRDAIPPRCPAPVLKLEGLRFAYPGRAPVFWCAGAQLAPGGVYWLRGANGSGKSTLAKLLAGVISPQQGHILADGRPIKLASKPGAVASYHFQNPDFQLFSTTVWDEVTTGPLAHGCSETEAAWRAAHVLEQIAVPASFHRTHPLDLPFALRKRLALAAAVACGCPWLILDEPSLGQDAQNTSAMRSLIRGLAQAGAGVLVISHSRRLTDGLALAELELVDGQIRTRLTSNTSLRQPL